MTVRVLPEPLVLLQEAMHQTRRVAFVIPQPMLIAIGAGNLRADAKLGLQAIRIKLRLLNAKCPNVINVMPKMALDAGGGDPRLSNRPQRVVRNR